MTATEEAAGGTWEHGCWRTGLTFTLARGVACLECGAREEHRRFMYVPQDISADLIEALEAAGFGKPGTPNTLWAMVYAALDALAASKREIDRLRRKNRELNRRAQRSASQARKDFVHELFGQGADHLPAWRIAQILGIDPSDKSFAELALKTEATLRELLRLADRLAEAVEEDNVANGGGSGASSRAVMDALAEYHRVRGT